MTKHRDLPEDARQPPVIVTPGQNADRAAQREDREEWRAEHGVASDPANPHDPLRQPGESSSPPAPLPGQPPGQDEGGDPD